MSWNCLYTSVPKVAQLAEPMDTRSWAAKGEHQCPHCSHTNQDSHPFHCCAAPKALALPIKPQLCMANERDQFPVRTRGPQTASLCSQPYLAFWHLFPKVQLKSSKPSAQSPLHCTEAWNSFSSPRKPSDQVPSPSQHQPGNIYAEY